MLPFESNSIMCLFCFANELVGLAFLSSLCLLPYMRRGGSVGANNVPGTPFVEVTGFKFVVLFWKARSCLSCRNSTYALVLGLSIQSPPQLTLHATPRTPRGIVRWVRAMSAWSVKIRRAPSGHCRGAMVYGHTTTAMPKLSTPPPPPPHDPRRACY